MLHFVETVSGAKFLFPQLRRTVLPTYKAIPHSVKNRSLLKNSAKLLFPAGQTCSPLANTCLLPPHLLTVKMPLHRSKDGLLHA